MPTNDFKAIAGSGGANVLTQSDFEALATTIANGLSGGIVPSNLFNKLFRQSSAVAAGVAQYIADLSGDNVLDNGDAAALLASLKKALAKQSAGALLRVSVFTASGTWNAGTGTKSVEVFVLGGGGQGGGVPTTSGSQRGVSGGGGAGGLAYKFIVGVASPQTVTVGSGGTGGSTGSGGNGGTTSFGSLLSATGGSGGQGGAIGTAVVSVAGGVGGAGTGGDININGGNGAPGVATSQCNVGAGGNGANSPNGLGAGGPGTVTATGTDGTGYGSGGGGLWSDVSNAGKNGGAGAPGLVIVKEYA